MKKEENLEELLPHAAPMTLLSGCMQGDDESEADAWVDVSPASPFYDASIGGVPGCVALEYMAQAMAAVAGLAHRRRGEQPKVGFVLGSRRMSIAIPVFRSGERYRVRAKCDYQDESFGSFDCKVEDPSGATVASARMTAFQPSGELTEEIMEKIR